MAGLICNPAIEAVLTMCPPSPCFRMRGTKVCTPCTTPNMFTPKIQFHSVGVNCSRLLTTATPALLQTMCTLLNAASTSSAARAIASASDTSSDSAIVFTPERSADGQSYAVCCPGDESDLAVDILHGRAPQTAVETIPRNRHAPRILA